MAFSSYVLVKKAGKRRESPLGHSKLAHQFWFSFPPPGSGGGSSNSKTAQTDEEKQRERQRSEQEHKKLEQGAINYKRDKESREARLLDLEIRRANEKDRRLKQQQQYQLQHQQQSISGQTSQQLSIDSQQGTSTQTIEYQQQVVGQQSQQYQQQQQQQQQPQTHLTHYQLNQSEKSTPTSVVTYVSEIKSPHDAAGSVGGGSVSGSGGGGGGVGVGVGVVSGGSVGLSVNIDNSGYDRSLPRAFRSRSAEKEKEQVEKRRIQTAVEANASKSIISTTPSPQTVTGPPSSRSILAGPPATAAAATAAIIPILPLGVATLRDDSTESDQSLTYPPPTHSQHDAYHRIVCRAPIASLDCMEEFSGTGGHLDFGRSISLGSNPALPLRHGSTPTPGLRYKNLGKSGLRVSNVGLGTWPVFSPGVTEEQSEAILKLSIESGINFFDISEAHSETEIGKHLRRLGWKRTSYAITTKIYWSTKSEERGLSRKHIIESVKASLERLQLPYIDVVIIHKADPMCPMEEVVRTMTYVIQQGWAMYWGTARWTQVEIMEAYTNCRQFNCITPIVEQSEYHMFCREKCELYLPEMYNKIGVGLMVWGPLSMALSETQNGDKILFPKGSFKTKSHSYSWTEDEVNKNSSTEKVYGWKADLVDGVEQPRRHSDRLRDLTSLAEKLGCSPVQLSIAWSLKHEPVHCLLLGATSAEQLHQSLQALQLLPRLSTGVMLELERILENKPVRPPMISTLALR